MNFFEAQERARKSSRLLVWWFALAVLGVILVMYVLATVSMHYGAGYTDSSNLTTQTPVLSWWNPELFLIIAGVVGTVIVVGSVSKTSQLSAGGKVVAESLGGRPVEQNTRDHYERRLLNVVEEMSIASGVPIPEVWIMDDEPGINAFAAGTDPANAVIGVTRGTLERLDRAELQGVVAHEFSHILNGDMKLNMRLMGWIFGLVMLSMLGRVIFQSVRHFRGSRDSKVGGLILALILAGLAVWLVGSVGVLFARMIQAAISRQREFLADASAVQFTRLPDGIAGALKKIGGFSEHGRILAPAATEARHMFFAGSSLNSVMATHPSLDQRIKAIDPNWNGKMLEAQILESDQEFNGTMGFAGEVQQIAARDRPEIFGNDTRMDSHVGELIRSGLVLEQDGQEFSKDQAKSLLLGLLVAANQEGFQLAGKILRMRGFDELNIGSVMGWSEKLAHKSSIEKLAMVDLSLVWLRRMDAQEARDFISLTQELTEADGQVEMFEFMLQQVIRRHVEIGTGMVPVPPIKFHKLAEIEAEMMNLLSAFGRVSGGEGVLGKAFQEYREHTGREPYQTEVGLGHVAEALSKMDASTPLVKQQVLRLCSLVVMDDGKVDDLEMELLRATAEAMGAPIPPMVRMVA
ncbi:MAG: M48 family metallopeptidase [Verrucomicrobiota bacterium]